MLSRIIEALEWILFVVFWTLLLTYSNPPPDNQVENIRAYTRRIEIRIHRLDDERAGDKNPAKHRHAQLHGKFGPQAGRDRVPAGHAAHPGGENELNRIMQVSPDQEALTGAGG
jgi:hypothetical protein